MVGPPSELAPEVRDLHVYSALGDGLLLARHCVYDARARKDAPADEIAFVTPVDTERALRTKLETLHCLKPLSVLHVADC